MKKIKRKYCITFSVILLVLFSLTAISADEDADLYSSADDSSDGNMLQIQDKVETDTNPTSINQENVLASDDECDLSVNVSVDKSYDGNKFNRAGSEINWTVTVNVIEGVAHNTKVHLNFSSNMEYVSCNKTIGEYDSNNCIWDIGDFSSSQPATLILLTRLRSDGHFNLIANATTDSVDVNLLNNVVNKSTKSGTGNNGSNITENSTDRAGAQHGNYLTTIINPSPNDDRIRDPHPEERSKHNENNKTKKNGENNKTKKNGENNGNVESIYQSKTDSVTSKTLNPSSAVDSASSILEGEDSKSANLISKYVSDIIPPYDYTRIPILIFALLILALAGIVGYDKLKS